MTSLLLLLILLVNRFTLLLFSFSPMTVGGMGFIPERLLSDDDALMQWSTNRPGLRVNSGNPLGHSGEAGDLSLFSTACPGIRTEST